MILLMTMTLTMLLMLLMLNDARDVMAACTDAVSDEQRQAQLDSSTFSKLGVLSFVSLAKVTEEPVSSCG
jgi:hypothetical protein